MSVSSEPVVKRSLRIRTLTQPALDIYHVTVNKHYDKLNEIKSELRNLSEEIELARGDKETLLALDKVASCGESSFEKNADILRDFLRITRSVDSHRDLLQLDTERELFFAKSNAVRKRIQARVQQLEFDMISERKTDLSWHSTSRRSAQTSESSMLRRKEAKLEAQRVKIRHLEEELALKAKLKQLKAKRDLEMMEREVDVLKEPSDDLRSQLASSVNSAQKTRDYVENLPDTFRVEPETVNAGSHTLNPTAQPFEPKVPIQSNTQSEIVNTFTKHLVKQELIQTRLAKYDDDPMMFVAWKTSFQGIMKEVSATKTEELELLCEKLGPESSKQARKIRGYIAENPGLACEKIWERLEKRYGAPETVEACLHSRIKDFLNITAEKYPLLYDLTDLALEISAIKSQPKFCTLFAYFDSKKGVNELVEKLPWNIKEKWTSEATRYKLRNDALYPPFEFFVKFLENMASMRNDPAFQFERKVSSQRQTPAPRQDRSRFLSSPKQNVAAFKTDAEVHPDVSEICPLHKNGRHVLNECRPFRQKSIDERKKIILVSGICFRCCSGKKHRAKNCKADVKCNICQASTHPTALHEEESTSPPRGTSSAGSSGSQNHGGEGHSQTVKAMCTQISGVSKSCAKIVPVRIFHESNPKKSLVVYATIDDQSNQSLGTSSLFDYFGEYSTDVSYTLVSCSGAVAAAGRMCTGYKVQSLDKSCELAIPSLLECNDIPSNRNEIPSPDVALLYPHLSNLVPSISPVIENAGMELLIGRDIIRAHVVEDQILGEEFQPFAQKLPLGWVIVGQVCLGGMHKPEVSTMKTYILGNGRPSLVQPCENVLSVVQRDLFKKTDQDEKIGLSVEDRTFLEIMEESFEKDEDGRWTAPLPFKKNRSRLPNNRSQALQRARSFDRCLRHNEQKYVHVQDFMEKLFARGHAEKAPTISEDAECWFLPMFGVYHSKKPSSIRVVFDSSAQYQGTSLNDVLIKGPDLANNLQGILMRFRLEKFAVMADVEQMFHNFRVVEQHRNYLRFFWHPDHDLDSPLEEFRMTVHVFGNRTSPAVANYGLRKSVSFADSDVQNFVSKNFYVDDGLMSFPNVDQVC